MTVRIAIASNVFVVEAPGRAVISVSLAWRGYLPERIRELTRTLPDGYTGTLDMTAEEIDQCEYAQEVQENVESKPYRVVAKQERYRGGKW